MTEYELTQDLQAIDQVTITEKKCAERHGVRNDEQPHGQLSRRDRVRRSFHQVIGPMQRRLCVDCHFRLAHSFSPSASYSFTKHSRNRYTHSTPMKCQYTAVTSMAEGDRLALYHLAVDQKLADFYKEALRLSGDDHALPLVVKMLAMLPNFVLPLMKSIAESRLGSSIVLATGPKISCFAIFMSEVTESKIVGPR